MGGYTLNFDIKKYYAVKQSFKKEMEGVIVNTNLKTNLTDEKKLWIIAMLTWTYTNVSDELYVRSQKHEGSIRAYHESAFGFLNVRIPDINAEFPR